MRAFPLQQDERGSVEEIEAGVPVFADQFQAIDGLVVKRFLANQFDLVSFSLVVHQRAVKIRFVRDVFQIFRGHRLDAFVFVKWIDHPAAGLAVINTKDFLAVDVDFRAHLVRALEFHNEGAFLPRPECDPPADTLRSHSLDFRRSSPCVECFLNHFFGRLGACAQRREQE